MSIFDSRELERLRHRQGQVLRSRDFRDQAAIEAQFRWWHNRSLHNVFGVSMGLKTSPVVDEQGLITAIRVTYGIAYDYFGRELVLQEVQEIPVPGAQENEGAIMLLIRYKGTNLFPKRGEVPDICVGAKLSQYHEQPEFVWKPSKLFRFNDGVPLAMLKYESGIPALDEEFTSPLSRPIARPRIASGSTIPGSTAWEAWKEKDIIIGFQVRIDTLAAGFTEVPCYFAWLQVPLWNQNDSQFLIAPFEHIDESSINGFVFRVLMPMLGTLSGKKANEDFKNNFLTFAQKRGLFVCWLGIQPWPDYKNQKK